LASATARHNATGAAINTLDKALDSEEARFLRRVPGSKALHAKAIKTVPGGVGSCWANSRPAPVWVERGEGPYVWDVDGNRYVDFHAGYGANVVGHAHPAIVSAIQKRVMNGTHFAQPTRDMIDVSENLAARFGLPKWRFSNSGTEATMDAVKLMRCITGKDIIVKIEGCYNGHSDSLLISINRNENALGPVENPHRVPGPGVTQASADNVRIVPYNNLPMMEKIFADNKGKIAGVILEPYMMNAGIITPAPGYLEGLRRITKDNSALLTFDEVKTGLVVHQGGVTKLNGVTPDIVCLAKALGGGVPCGAIGGSNDVMRAIEEGLFNQVGTFNANPLTMAAAKATLTEVLTDNAYSKANELGEYMLENCLDVLRDFNQPAYGTNMGFKMSVVMNETGEPVSNYREFLQIDTASSHLHFLKQFNNGVFLPPWGKSETLTLSVAHTRKHADQYIANLVNFMQTMDRLAQRKSLNPAYAPGSFDMHAEEMTA
jgi:glutamate-1-semialdehyde 2,1-aminomutase